MDTFDPIAASKSIRTSFIDYITTRFAWLTPSMLPNYEMNYINRIILQRALTLSSLDHT